MDSITRKATQLQIVLSAYVGGMIGRSRRDDSGQASTEYAGILFVVVAIIVALIGLGFTDVGTAIKGKITEAISGL